MTDPPAPSDDDPRLGSSERGAEDAGARNRPQRGRGGPDTSGFASTAVLPGPELTAELVAADLASLSISELLDVLAGWERVRAWVDSHTQQVLATLDGRDGTDDRWLIEEVATAMRLAPVTAANRLNRAATLVSRLPRTMVALQRGELSPPHVQAIVDGAAELPTDTPDDRASALEEAALRRASDQTLSELRRTVTRAVHRLDPLTQQARHVRARAERGVFLRDAGHGMTELLALLPTTDAGVLYTRVDAAARLLPRDDGRTLDQQRADVLVDGVLSGIPIDGLPTVQGRAPQLNITVPLSTLVGDDDEAAELTTTAGGASAVNGPITAVVARSLASDRTATWRRFITDSAGDVVRIDRMGRVPGAV